MAPAIRTCLEHLGEGYSKCQHSRNSRQVPSRNLASPREGCTRYCRILHYPRTIWTLRSQNVATFCIDLIELRSRLYLYGHGWKGLVV